MNKLDLHGVRHGDVQQEVDHFLFENNDRLPLQIVTGNSGRMKEIVIEVLNDYDYKYRVGDFLGFNQGYIEIYG